MLGYVRICLMLKDMKMVMRFLMLERLLPEWFGILTHPQPLLLSLLLFPALSNFDNINMVFYYEDDKNSNWSIKTLPGYVLQRPSLSLIVQGLQFYFKVIH